jgi:hypothetical protein
MMNTDDKWMDALAPYWGGKFVPEWKLADGSIDAAKTIDFLMESRGQKKSGKNGGDSAP